MAKSTSHPQIFRVIQPLSPEEVIRLLEKLFNDSHEGQAQKFGWLGLSIHQRITDLFSKLNIDLDARLTKALVSFSIRSTLDFIAEQLYMDPNSLDFLKPQPAVLFDKYLEYQYRQTGEFYTSLFEMISHADHLNLAKLNKSYPAEVQAYLCFRDRPLEEFVRGCSPDHPLISQFKKENNLP